MNGSSGGDTRWSRSRREVLKGGAVVGGAAFLSQLLAACGGQNGNASGLQTINAGYQTPSSSGLFYLAQQYGWFKDSGLEVDLTVFDGGPPILSAMAGGSIDVGNCGSIPVLQAAATGIFTVRIISVMDDVGGDYSIVATKDITTVPDLKGKSIAFGVGTNFEYFLDLVLAKYGMTQEDVNVVNADVADANSAFMSGDVDATLPLTQSQSQLLKEIPGSHVLFDGTDFPKPPNPGPSPLIFDLIFTSQDKIIQLPKALGAYVKVYNGKAIDYLTSPATKTRAIAELAKWSNDVIDAPTTVAGVVSNIDAYNFYPGNQVKTLLSSGQVKTALQSQSQWLLSKGTIKSMPDLSTCIYPDFINALSSL